MKNIPDVGQVAPDFEVETAHQSRFHLQAMLDSGQNVMLVFYRGHW